MKFSIYLNRRVFIMKGEVSCESNCSFFFVRLWFSYVAFICHCLFLISLSFGVSVGLCTVIVAFPGYLH